MSDTSPNTTNASGDLAAWRPASGSAVSARHRWQGRGRLSNGTGKKRRKYRAQGVVTLLLLATMATIFTHFVPFHPQKTPLIAVVATKYESPFIPNAWAREGLLYLRQLDSEAIQLDEVPDEMFGREELKNELRQRLGAGFKNVENGRPLILYLSMHAGVNDKNEACLIPPAAHPLKPDTWFPVEELFKIVDTQREDEPNKHALLVFECVRSQNNWYRGETGNDFYTQLEKLTKLSKYQSKYPNIHVMTACSPSENSFAAPHLKQTVFSKCFTEGLSGAANTEGAGNGGTHVSLRELFAFVHTEVSEQRKIYCNESQTPQLFKTGAIPESNEDLILTFCLGGTLNSKTEPSDGMDSEKTEPVSEIDPKKSLEKLWRLAEDIHSRSPYDENPAAWAVWQRDLLRLEALYDAGTAYTDAAEKLDADLSERAKDFSAKIQPDNPCPPILKAKDWHEFQKELDAVFDNTEHSEFQLARLLAPQYIAGESQGRLKDLLFVLQTKHEAEEIVRHNKHRTLQWSKKFLKTADDDRRSNEDHAFAGQMNELNRDVMDNYEKVKTRTASVGKAFEIRDQSLSELFWYFLWTDGAPHTEKKVIAADELAKSTQKLNDALIKNSEEDRDADPLPFEGLYKETEKCRELCHKLISEEYKHVLERVDEGDESPELLKRCMNLRKVPILPAEEGAEQRVKLILATNKILQERIKLWKDDESEGDESEGDESEGDESEGDESEGDESEDDESEDDASEGDESEGDESQDDECSRLHRLMQELIPDPTEERSDDSPRFVLNELPQDLEQAADFKTERPEGYQKKLGYAQSTFRVMAPTLNTTDSEAVTRAAKNLEKSLHLLLTVQRDLEDFYGPTLEWKTPYFEEICSDRLNQLTKYAPRPPGVETQVRQLCKKLVGRGKAAINCVDLKTDKVCVLLADGSPLGPVKISLVGTDSSANLPDKICPSVWLQSSGQTTLLDAQLARNPKKVEEQFYDLSTPDFKDSEPPQMSVVASFRGNRFRQHIQVSRAGGREVTVSNKPSEKSKLTVNGSGPASASTVVILDCSQSMSEKIQFEEQGGPQTRFEAAAGALRNLLEQLATADRENVGLIFFGHRVGWNPRNSNQLLPQIGYKRAIPDGLRPYEDVECLLPVGRFDNAVLNSIQPLIDSVIPWGETPLYLALTEAFEALKQKDGLSQPRIIVITDGANRQTNPTLDKARQLSDVLSKLDKKTPIYIVGFQLRDQDRIAAVTEYQQIADESGGEFFEVGAAGGIIDLKDLLNEPEEQKSFDLLVENDEDKQGVFGEPISVDVPSPGGIDVTVKYGEASQELHLDGGEHLQLRLNEEQSAFQIVSAQVPPLKQGVLHNGYATFRVSRQYIQQEPIKRPLGIQLEIQPQNSEAVVVEPPFKVSTTYFEEETSTPVVQFRISNWPRDATQASITASVIRNTPESIKLSELEAQNGHLYLSSSVKGRDIKIHVLAAPLSQPQELTVIEEHGEKSPGLDTLVARFQLPGQGMERVRRVDSKHRVVRTTYKFDCLDSDNLKKHILKLMVVDASDDDSLELRPPIVVPVTADHALLRR